MKAIDVAVQQAKSLGLNCKRFLRKETAEGFHPRKLLIAGQKCQVVSAPIQRDAPHIERLPVYLPTSLWPDFLIYVSKGSGPPMLFIVPRGMLAKHTGICSLENWLFQFQDAWSLLSENLTPAELQRRFEPLNWKMDAVVAAARKKGASVELLPKAAFHWPYRKQNKLVINGRRCQVMSAHRISNDRASHMFNVVNVRKPKSDWAEFLIYLVREPDEKISFFIMPSEEAPARTTVTLTGWLMSYKENWEPLTGETRSPDRMIPQRSARTPRIQKKRTMPAHIEKREKSLRLAIGQALPEFVKMLDESEEDGIVVIHQDEFAPNYDDYGLLGMVVKFAGLYGKEVQIIGTNRETLTAVATTAPA